MSLPPEIPPLLHSFSSQDEALWSEQIHSMLREIAERHLRRESGPVTLTPTELVKRVWRARPYWKPRWQRYPRACSELERCSRHTEEGRNVISRMSAQIFIP